MFPRAQVSFDLMVVLGIMLLLFLSLFQFYSAKAESVQLVREKTSAKEVAEALAAKINVVLQSGNGTVANYSIPAALADGVDYSIIAGNRRVEIAFSGNAVSSLILTGDLISVDLNARRGSQVRISNINDGILLE